ncbi:MAG TPA: hypothetical protein EYP43_04235 [Thermoplasmata archaeon]|nr:hypothetical protein [Thermoplasmata archaeon]
MLDRIVHRRIMEVLSCGIAPRAPLMELMLLLNSSERELTRHLECLERAGFIARRENVRGGNFCDDLLAYGITEEGVSAITVGAVVPRMPSREPTPVSISG